jgi:hypothetical protein
MSNLERFVDHFKHCNTVDVGLESISSFLTEASHFRFAPMSGHLQSRAAFLKGETSQTIPWMCAIRP